MVLFKIAMPVSPSDFLESAAAIIAADTSEISIRNSLSRAYYGAFHCASEAFPVETLPASDEDAENAGMHKKYINRLLQGNKIEREAGVKLGALHSRRIKADYKLTISVPVRDVAMQIDGTKILFSICKNAGISNQTVAGGTAKTDEKNESSEQPSDQTDSNCGRPKLVRVF